jgi:TRAP-type mannitol/chloroaromatic compound transport system permease small subunit
MRFIKLALRSVDRLSEGIGLLVSVLMPAMVLVLAIEVVARYVFNSPTIWAYDTAIFMFGYTGLLGGAYALKRKEHINVDLFYTRFSLRGRAVLDVITGLLFFFFMGLVVVYGWTAAIEALKGGEATATLWGPPIGHFKLMIPIGAGLLILQGLANWIRSLYLAATNKELDA